MNVSTEYSKFNVTLLATAIASSFLFPISAMANDDSASDDVETISIFGQAYRNTATKTSLEPEETPQGITVLDGEVLEQRSVKSLNEALRYVPGVTTEQKGGAVTMYDTFNIRGFDVNQSYYDGLVLQYLNGWNLQPQIDPIAIQQIEVFKGPTSVLYGSMPPGGMVNMIAKTPQKEKSTDVKVATGTGNLVEASIDTTGQFGDSDFSYRFIALARQKDGQVDYTEEERYVIAPSVDWQVSDRTLINFNMYYQNDPSMGMNSAMPASGMIYDNPNGSTDPSTFVGDKNWSTFEREFFMAGYKINHEFNNNWSFLQNFRYMNASLYQENTYHIESNFDPSTGNLDRNIYSTDESSTGYTIDNQLSGRVMVGSVEHNLLFGIDYQKLDGDSLYQEFGTTSQFGNFNIFNPNNNMIDRGKLTQSYESKEKISVEQLGFYTQDQIRIDRLVLIAGGRFDQYKSSNTTSTTSKDADQSQFSYRVGALYELESGFSPFISYATSFEPAAGLDAKGNAYDPELGEQIEAGVKYESADYTKTASASVFKIVKSDALMSDPSDPWGPQLQIGEIRSQGLELQGQWMVNDSWDIAANYTYIDMEITKDSGNDLEGKTPIYVPTHAASLWSNYYIYDGILTGTRISGGLRYVGEMEMDAANTDKVPDYTLADVSIGYELDGISESLTGATAQLSATNLFNTEYYSCYDSANCWYGAEQTVELSINYNF
ncbi:TonB-dependent siderophore receptor [Aliivibrio fischeri]|uniref:TonB-dependent siderophore receptor n=1 Tax=Aliivibrio fischeri TaxID=668 RepID=UPI001060F77A|nr:TonB-dependent siderophore receptor [Aliivibrio fischeri]MCE7555152.1 TonB-dependent siderophore receptor [Aliivibrio fischeri]MCE7562420.1 TonB-dependent siderophore receptor [Aliivibrio fischeri]MCE7569828.1 TonB-dependent siderophore receptor [Aliivibrio fischeri]MUK94551.1 TonB-dependent siderophore receptor [Aliivibrio fischeri]TDM51612.1 TonB-dependent siderophore receptor [Aliivibrio fischeri]